MRSRPQAQALESNDLDFLQGCFDLVVARNILDRKSKLADQVASLLVETYGRGIRDRMELIWVAELAIAAHRRSIAVDRPFQRSGERS